MDNKTLNILYMAEDYFSSAVHHHLCDDLGCYGVDVNLFTIRRVAHQQTHLSYLWDKYTYRLLLSSLDVSEWLYRVVFSYKIKTKSRLLHNQIDLSNITLIHAATLFSEGALAYLLYQKYKIPYILTICGTDYFLYLKKMPHLWRIGLKIIKNAKAIVFSTPYFQRELLAHPYFRSIQEEIEQKTAIIPFGVNSFWLDNISPKRISDKMPYKLLFVGNFDSAKNLLNLVKACQQIKEKHPNMELHLVGGGGDLHHKMEQIANQKEWIINHGRINNQQELCDIYRSCHLYVMPSYDTFGLTYIEALSQRLPLLYGKNAGFDGFYPEGNIGFRADTHSCNDIAEKMEQLMLNYPTLLNQIEKTSLEPYRWSIVAKQHADLYHSVINCQKS